MLTRCQQTRFEISDKRRITFYAAVFNQPTTIREESRGGGIQTYKEVIRPGAFTDSLNSSDPITANIDHDDTRKFSSFPDMGLILQEDPHGLFCSAWMPQTPEGDLHLERIARGELNACSFRFTPVLDRTEGGTVERVSVKLADVCLTNNPAYKQTAGSVHHHRTGQDKMRYLSARARYAKIKDWTLNTNVNNNHGAI